MMAPIDEMMGVFMAQKYPNIQHDAGYTTYLLFMAYLHTQKNTSSNREINCHRSEKRRLKGHVYPYTQKTVNTLFISMNSYE